MQKREAELSQLAAELSHKATAVEAAHQQATTRTSSDDSREAHLMTLFKGLAARETQLAEREHSLLQAERTSEHALQVRCLLCILHLSGQLPDLNRRCGVCLCPGRHTTSHVLAASEIVSMRRWCRCQC
jgi:hypothetical protein